MKKDIEWLKDEVDKLKIYVNPDAPNNPNDLYGQYVSGVNEAIRQVKMLCGELDEPEVLTEELIYEKAIDTHVDTANGEIQVTFILDDLQNLLVPKQDKPAIPKFVADWIDSHNLYGNDPLREYRDLENDFNEGWTDEEDAAVYHWVNENPYAFIDAIRYGYEVEEEQKYYVLTSSNKILLKKDNGEVRETYQAYSWIKKRNKEYYQLTEQEIKDYDERCMSFSVKIEEMEE